MHRPFFPTRHNKFSILTWEISTILQIFGGASFIFKSAVVNNTITPRKPYFQYQTTSKLIEKYYRAQIRRLSRYCMQRNRLDMKFEDLVLLTRGNMCPLMICACTGKCMYSTSKYPGISAARSLKTSVSLESEIWVLISCS